MLAVTAPVPFVGTGVIFFQGTIGEIRGWSPAVFPTGFMLFAIVRALFSLSAGAWVDRIGSVRCGCSPRRAVNPHQSGPIFGPPGGSALG
ncbi:MAG TPA: hypothetical protein VGA56_24455 [Opitutaceae bacterium]